MSDNIRPCWQNCFLPDDKDQELAAVDAMEDALAPLDEDTGRLIEPKNVEQLTKACAELIEDEKLRNKLGTQGRQSVEEKFAPEEMVNTIESVYKELTGK
ncbi:MAG: glycosyltransferase [Planctomycetota bacterium]|jgi:glycosyltransferase involved in cell wall biosynthesis